MKRSIFILIASFVLAFATIGGMAVFGMDTAGMHMDSGVGGVDCLEQCLDAISDATIGTIPATVSTFLLAVLIAQMVSLRSSSAVATIRSLVRWREGIGKARWRRELATVRIQD